MKYTVRCYRATGRYRTTIVVSYYETLKEVWDHISKCPHGHEIH